MSDRPSAPQNSYSDELWRRRRDVLVIVPVIGVTRSPGDAAIDLVAMASATTFRDPPDVAVGAAMPSVSMLAVARLVGQRA